MADKPTIPDNSLIEDILDDDLAYNNRRITINQIYNASFLRRTGHTDRLTRTPKNAISSLTDVYTKIRLAVEHYETRSNTPTRDRIVFTEDKTDREAHPVIIAVSCQGRDPGSFSQGTPLKPGVVKELLPHLREEVNDPDHKGYKVAIVGKSYDNVIRLTCWARTNKEANRRADWVENLMDEYNWWFASEGIIRCVFIGRKTDEVEDDKGNRWYGRPLDYFVRTEKISMRSEKQIEEILLKVTLADE